MAAGAGSVFTGGQDMKDQSPTQTQKAIEVGQSSTFSVQQMKADSLIVSNPQMKVDIYEKGSHMNNQNQEDEVSFIFS